MLLEALRNYTKYFVVALAGLWWIAVATLTFNYKDEPEMGIFSNAGNGFFATWAAFFISFILCFTVWIEGVTEVITTTPSCHHQP